jgi:ABC-type transport system substrate-binding protein
MRMALCRAMDATSLISAFLAAQVGQFQLAAAAFLAQSNPDSGSSVAQLTDAAQQNFDPLANVAAGLGTNLDVSA